MRAVRTRHRRQGLAFLLFGLAASAAAQSITEIALSDPHSGPGAIVKGPDGNLWFTERQINSVGMLPSSGDNPTNFPAPVVSAGGLTLRTQSITAGQDGNLWYLATEAGNGVVGKFTTAGVGTVVSAVIANRLFSITWVGGNLWFTGVANSVLTIRKMTTDGAVTEYPVPSPNTFGSATSGIVGGPDLNIWFTESSANKIGRITPSGVITEFALPAGSGPGAICVGTDQALYFTEAGTNKIGRMTTAGVLTEYPVPTPSAALQDITSGPDGNLWFTESIAAANKIARIQPGGSAVLEFTVPTPNSIPFGIASANGSLWFTETNVGKIGRLPQGSGPPPPTPTAGGPGPTPTPAPHVPRGRVTPVSAPTPKAGITGRP
jgi:virginiamycin B lyase